MSGSSLQLVQPSPKEHPGTMPRASQSSKKQKMVHPGLIPQQLMMPHMMNPMMMGQMNPMMMHQMQQMGQMAGMGGMGAAVPEQQEARESEGASGDETNAAGAAGAASAAVVPANGSGAPVLDPFKREAIKIRDNSGQDQGDMISRSVTFVKGVPRNRQAEGLEWLSRELDTTLTCNLSSEGLCCLLYMATRLKPSTKISDLRALN